MRFILAIFVVIIGVAGCSVGGKTGGDYTHIDGFCQGTTYSIIYADTVDLRAEIEGILDDFDQSLSIYNPSSTLVQHNKNAITEVDSTFMACFILALEFRALTGGLFDPTLGPLIAAYGFGPAAKNAAQKSAEIGGSERGERGGLAGAEIERLRGLVGIEQYTLDTLALTLKKRNPAAQLDFNAIAQGLSVDLVGRFLGSRGIENYMVEIGGEVVCQGLSPSGRKWRIGVDRPHHGNFLSGESLSAIVEISGEGLATSGNYRKFITQADGQQITHTIDPRSGRPTSHNLLSATIIAPTAAMADAVATACMVGGVEWSHAFLDQHHPTIRGLLIYSSEDEGQMLNHSTLEIIEVPTS